MSYNKHFNTRATPQSQRIPGRPEMVQNAAGGYAFPVTDWVQAERFLILGTQGGTYYTKESDLTIASANAIVGLLKDKESGKSVVELIVDVSANNRATKNTPALFALAMAVSPDVSPHEEVRQLAFAALPQVARIGTHLFQFVDFAESFRGWGRAMRRAVSNWYLTMRASRLAYQAVKYQQREGWSHTDVLRLAHPKPTSNAQTAVFKWITGKENLEEAADLLELDDLRIIYGYECAKRATSPAEIVTLIEQYNLTREMIPTQFLKNENVWMALLQRMPLTALIRSLNRLSNLKLLNTFSTGEQLVISKLSNTNYVAKSRLHPWSILTSAHWYAQGRGLRGKLTWEPNQRVIDTMQDAFYNAFNNVEPTGKRIVLAVDKSGSMMSRQVSGEHPRGRGMQAVQAAAALAMVTARTEPNHLILKFDSSASEAKISGRTRMVDAVKALRPGGGTDYGSPVVYCLERRIPVDAFVVIGDEESWFGRRHPVQLLHEYRRKMNLQAKMVVLNLCSTTTQVDPSDAGMLNMVGLDTNAPKVISEFIK